MHEEEMDELLRNWALLNTRLMELDENVVEQLIKRESETKGRLRVMLRCYNRYSKLRAAREKRELAGKVRA